MSDSPRPLLAAAWMTGAIVSLSSMAVAGRAVYPELDSFELLMYRSAIGMVILVVLGGATGSLGEVRTGRFRLHLLRNIAHFVGQNLWFTALPLISLAQLFALEFTSPIWVVIFAILFAGERLSRARAVALALGFAGAIIVARPGVGGDPLGLALAAISAVGFAGAIVTTRLLTRSETTYCVLFWMTIMQTCMGVVAAGWDGDIAWPSAAAWAWLALLGCAGLIANTCLAKALAVAPAIVVTPMDFLRLPAIVVVGSVFYSEGIEPGVLLGAALIFSGNYFNIWNETRRKSRR